MTTNTNLRYYLEFYLASDAEESDPDPDFDASGMSLRELYVALAKHLGVLEVVPTRIDSEFGVTRFDIASLASPNHSRGVACVWTEEI
jgi:hypothetical protein